MSNLYPKGFANFIPDVDREPEPATQKGDEARNSAPPDPFWDEPPDTMTEDVDVYTVIQAQPALSLGGPPLVDRGIELRDEELTVRIMA